MKKIFVASAFIAIQTIASAQDLDPSHSWKSAQVHVPGNWFQKTVDTVEVNKPLPVVVYLHGCAGIREHAAGWASYLKKLGYIVVIPDSFALPNRPSNCDPRTYRYVRNINVNVLRPAEAEYALKQLQSMPWADKNNIFLMGHSEGGLGASLVKETFKGVIVSGNYCRWGISSPLHVPILAIEHEKDPWFPWSQFHCVDKWGERNGATQIVIKGTGHNTSGIKEAEKAVMNFLNRLVNER